MAKYDRRGGVPVGAIVFGIGFLVWLPFPFFGAWIARQKCRSMAEGAILGALFGPLGALIEALLPTRLTPFGEPWQSRPTSKVVPAVLREVWYFALVLATVLLVYVIWSAR